MIVRCRVRVAFGLSCLFLLSASGCSDRFLAGPMYYVENDALTKEIKGKSNLAGKPKLQDKVRIALARLYGESPTKIKVPEGMGSLVARWVIGWRTTARTGDGANARITPNVILNPKTQEKKWITGGYGSLPPTVPALPRRLGRWRRTHLGVPLSDASRLSQGSVQIHLDPLWSPASSRRPQADRQKWTARDVDAGF